jgi:DNA-binding PadR family transcriptional regulator
MLSKLTMLISGLIAQRPLNPYGITKILKRSNINKWFPMALPSIYPTIKKMLKKGLITGTIAKDGNMPQKTIYTLTESGKKQSIESLSQFLQSIDKDVTHFEIAVYLLCNLDREKAINALKARLERLNNSLAEIKSMKDFAEPNSSLPFSAKIIMKYNLYIRQADKKVTEELLETVQNQEEWDVFVALTRRLYDDYGK